MAYCAEQLTCAPLHRTLGERILSRDTFATVRYSVLQAVHS